MMVEPYRLHQPCVHPCFDDVCHAHFSRKNLHVGVLSVELQQHEPLYQ
jgi:hypothetical protein